VSPVAEIIAQEIKAQGVISFARFMHLALYCPVCGYYEKEEDTIGRAGDYYTSVSVGPLFGELLALQFAEWLEPKPGRSLSQPLPGPTAATGALQIVEAGAHNGELARDLLTWLRTRRPALYDRLDYWIIEPSERRQGWQTRTLGEFTSKVRWFRNLPEVGSPAAEPPSAGGSPARPRFAGVRGIIFANELLDSMPVHRLGWQAATQSWFEWGVALQADRFVWKRLPEGTSGNRYHGLLPMVPAPLAAVLPDDFIIEVGAEAAAWWSHAAKGLHSGRLLTIDYGLNADELLLPERQAGTLRAYRGHLATRDLLTAPGEQDLTADVNFTHIRSAGEAAGLVTEHFLSQAQFLTPLAARAWQNEEAFGQWTPGRKRQFQTLIHPEHLGRPFRVLVQTRATPPAQPGGDCNS
jgi:SAM-dependent MidA family methyltransferase